MIDLGLSVNVVQIIKDAQVQSLISHWVSITSLGKDLLKHDVVDYLHVQYDSQN